MLRIHFTDGDLVRLQLADRPDPMWETVLSLQILRASYGSAIFNGWRRRVRDDLHRAGLAKTVRHLLFPLTPDASYFPDFLTPPEGLLGLGSGIEAVLATPRQRISRELHRLELPKPRPSWAGRLAAGERDMLSELGDGLAAYFRTAIAPYWDRICNDAQVDHASRGRHRRLGGIDAQLAGFWPMMRWRPPVLEVPKPFDKDLHLGGRGLILVPSFFCWYHPVALADPILPPTLVYPLHPASGPLGPGAPDLYARSTPSTALGRLIGRTRASVLGLTTQGATTSELARSAGISVATASQHAGVLREVGLITSRRDTNAVIHTLTPLGAALLGAGEATAGNGDETATRRRSRADSS
ncbi:winged helix-turn-helix transcriptional regulator [Actinomadura rudentiformis]|uniref:Winged helix-turn-helix transcriptional regulator n=2 Tax=Actinomadura rudentiformis TaxID=359158 RepID=A0A6H9YKR4_9ACTN|nr:winged helix-turn-helix transcriptional regulator [Actinomadura rudentiformis]